MASGFVLKKILRRSMISAVVFATACGSAPGEEPGESTHYTLVPPVTSSNVNVTMVSGEINSWRCGNMNFDLDGDNVTLQAGEQITDAYASWGVSVSTFESDNVTPGVGIIFDSSNPTGGDSDLGTPNMNYGGPGVGSGGWSNQSSRYGLLIKAENTNDANGDGLIDVPDDDASGGTFKFQFNEDMCILGVGLVDIEQSEAPVNLVSIDASGNVISDRLVHGFGNNSAQYSPVGECGARTFAVGLHGSGAIDSVSFCAGQPRNYSIEIYDDMDDVRDVEFDVQVRGEHATDGWVPVASGHFKQYPGLLNIDGAVPDAPLSSDSPNAGHYSRVKIRLANVETVHFDGTRVSHPSTQWTTLSHAFDVPACGTFDMDIDYELNVRTQMDFHELALGLEFASVATTSATGTCN